MIVMQTRDPKPDRDRNTLLAFDIAVLLVAGGLFLAVAEDVASGDPLVILDARIATWLHAHASPGLTKFFLLVTYVHGLVPIGAFTLVLAGVLAWQRDWYWLLRVGLVVPGGIVLNSLLKQAYQRARPGFDEPLLTLTSFSFPSGHTAGAVLFYGMLAAVVMSRLDGRGARAACILLAVLLVALVGFSRMYLGVHYLSDVVAAACASLAWMAFCLGAVHALSLRRAVR